MSACVYGFRYILHVSDGLICVYTNASAFFHFSATKVLQWIQNDELRRVRSKRYTKKVYVENDTTGF